MTYFLEVSWFHESLKKSTCKYRICCPHTSKLRLLLEPRGVTMGGKRGTILRALNHCGGAEKSQQCHKHFCFRKTSGSNMGAPNLLLAPGAI